MRESVGVTEDDDCPRCTKEWEFNVPMKVELNRSDNTIAFGTTTLQNLCCMVITIFSVTVIAGRMLV